VSCGGPNAAVLHVVGHPRPASQMSAARQISVARRAPTSHGPYRLGRDSPQRRPSMAGPRSPVSLSRALAPSLRQKETSRRPCVARPPRPAQCPLAQPASARVPKKTPSALPRSTVAHHPRSAFGCATVACPVAAGRSRVPRPQPWSSAVLSVHASPRSQSPRIYGLCLSSLYIIKAHPR